jgi:hypothetical protein
MDESSSLKTHLALKMLLFCIHLLSAVIISEMVNMITKSLMNDVTIVVVLLNFSARRIINRVVKRRFSETYEFPAIFYPFGNNRFDSYVYFLCLAFCLNSI